VVRGVTQDGLVVHDRRAGVVLERAPNERVPTKGGVVQSVLAMARLMNTTPLIAAPVVVLVEPDERLRGSMCDALDAAGFLVASYASTRSAERLVGELQPDLVIVDTDESTERPSIDRLLAGFRDATRIVAGASALAAEMSERHEVVHVSEALDVAAMVQRVQEHIIAGRRSSPSGRPSRSSSWASIRAARTILVVEDDVTLSAVIASALADEGYVAKVATTAEEARRALAEEIPTAMVLDLTLPDAFGGDLLAEATARGRRPPTVIVSTFPLAELIARRYEVELVRKPFELDALLAAVGRLARARRSLRAAT
jgi:DNA-binding response OmpR family regulator